MSHVLPPGDRGQRYEIRYRRRGDTSDRVLGWAETGNGARHMRDTWRKAPDVVEVWIVDRTGKRG